MIDYDEDEQFSAYARAENELKRVDHLIYVSLKYTRTVDVIKNIINRLINCYDFILIDLIERVERQGKLYEPPSAPGLKIKMVREHYIQQHPALEPHLKFYILLRQLDKSSYKALREFRRHVTMVAELPTGDIVEVNIDIITEYFNQTKEFMKYIKQAFFVKKE